MRRILFPALVVVCVLLITSPVQAGQNNYGCGLGSMIWENSDGLLYELFAAGTNAFFGSQIFGISSGTSNCEKSESLFSSKKVNTFVADNMDSLASDIAKGKGEYIQTLAILLEVPPVQRPDFYSRLQSNFSKIYPGSAVTHTDVLRNIAAIM